MRFTERHIDIIKTQFENKANRNCKVLDIMMRHLRFLKRHEKEVRQAIYQASEYIEVPAQTVLFKMGDVADYMYVILKGRVVISNTHSFYKDINRILSTLKDGEEFGNMSIVDPDASIADAEPDNTNDRNKRSTIAKTVEVSRMLRISLIDAKAIMQPG